MTVFSENLYRARKNKRTTKTKMANELGISLDTYILYEMGEKKPSSQELKKISALLEVSIDDLFTAKELHIYLGMLFHTNR